MRIIKSWLTTEIVVTLGHRIINRRPSLLSIEMNFIEVISSRYIVNHQKLKEEDVTGYEFRDLEDFLVDYRIGLSPYFQGLQMNQWGGSTLLVVEPSVDFIIIPSIHRIGNLINPLTDFSRPGRTFLLRSSVTILALAGGWNDFQFTNTVK